MSLYKKEAVAAALEKLGIAELRPWQREVMPVVYQGDDLFLSVPTSGGKSLTYQLPAVLEAGQALTVVVSPLRALQQDQAAYLTKQGISAAYLNGDLSNRERKGLLSHILTVQRAKQSLRNGNSSGRIHNRKHPASSSRYKTNPNPSPIGIRFGFRCFGGDCWTRTSDLLRVKRLRSLKAVANT